MKFYFHVIFFEIEPQRRVYFHVILLLPYVNQWATYKLHYLYVFDEMSESCQLFIWKWYDMMIVMYNWIANCVHIKLILLNGGLNLQFYSFSWTKGKLYGSKTLNLLGATIWFFSNIWIDFVRRKFGWESSENCEKEWLWVEEKKPIFWLWLQPSKNWLNWHNKCGSINIKFCCR